MESRSQQQPSESGIETASAPRHFSHPPISPSMAASRTDALSRLDVSAQPGTPPRPGAQSTPDQSTLRSRIATGIREPMRAPPIARNVSPARSTARSTNSVATIAKIRRLEYEGQLQLADIKRQELAIQASVVKKKMRMHIADVEAEEAAQADQESMDEAAHEERFTSWLHMQLQHSAQDPATEEGPLRLHDTTLLPRRRDEHRELSPPRHRELSPPRRRELSPPRCRDEHRELTPPRRCDEHRELSLPRRRELSPPRHRDEHRELSPPRHRDEHRELTPPRRRDEHFEFSPPRNCGEHRELSRPRQRDEHHELLPPRQRDNRRNISPPRRRLSTPRQLDEFPHHPEPRSDIEKLAHAIQSMSVSRPLLRYATELPTFSGSVTEWLPFKAALRDSQFLHRFSDTENMARLRASLRGEARETVSALLYTDTRPDRVIETLEQRFGQPEIIVEEVMNGIKNLPKPGHSPQELNKFAIKVENIINILRSINQEDYIRNPALVKEILNKIPQNTQDKWIDYARERHHETDLLIIKLSRFLMREAKAAMTYSNFAAMSTGPVPTRTAALIPMPTKSRNIIPARRKENIYVAEDEDKCPICNQGPHRPTRCSKLRQMKIEQRWEWARQSKTCFRCLDSQHRRSNCKAKPCGINGCRRPHHALLHEKGRNTETADMTSGAAVTPIDHNVASTSVVKTPAVIMEEINAVSVPVTRHTVLLKVCPITVTGPRGHVETYALLDEGSTITIIDEEVAEEVGAIGPTEPLHMRGINGTHEENDSRNINLRITGTNGLQHELRARTMKNLRLRKQSIKAELGKYPHLRGLHDLQYQNATPRVLIGADNWHLIVARQLRTGRRNEPAASETQLGWVVHGLFPQGLRRDDEETLLCVHHDRDVSLHQQVERHFRIDALGIAAATPKMSPENKRAIEMFVNTVRRVDCHFEVGLPWRTDHTELPKNIDYATRRLRSIEKKMDRDPAFAMQYTAQINNLLAKGYAEMSSQHDSADRQWFLPHFAVKNPNKPGKLRIVFDAAAKTAGVSLNDHLLEGPDLLASLPEILFRFRERPIAICADIAEMFLQIKIRKQDQWAQMFLWRGADRNDPPKKFKMTSMIFGASSSPFLAHSVRNKNAEDFEKEYPEAVKAIRTSHYMDDYVDSFNTTEEAIYITNNVIKIHAHAGFKLRGWNSNSKQVLEHLHYDQREQKDSVLLGPRNQEKTLGMLWDSRKDQLGFNTTMPRLDEHVRQGQRAPTKREMLSAVMAIYDPLGLLSCFTIRAKILLQDLWRCKTSWDEELPDEIKEKFRVWLQQLTDITELRVPRSYMVNGGSVVELHIFVDSSEQAYAAVGYWRTQQSEGTETALVAAKAKVAPLKQLSIPRLELQAALIGARLAQHIIKGHSWKPTRVVYWTDSQTVLQWIRTDTRRYTAFVAHRLSEIAELTNLNEWRWVPTRDNVADDATRAQFNGGAVSPRWIHGPAFLRYNEEDWPAEIITTKPLMETVATVTITKKQEDFPHLPDLKKFSKYTRLIRSTAYVLLFADRCRRLADHLEARHIETATILWIKRAQQDSFGDDLHRLRGSARIKKTSRLFPLDPYLEDDVLRLRGRIDAASAEYNTRRPIILDGRHDFTRLLILNEHETADHANHERVVNDLRRQFYIFHLRPTVRNIANKCQLCRVRRAKPRPPICGNLPAARLAEGQKPFTYCGTDYFGPMIVTTGRRREKRWGALFTCLTTRAVHIEIASSLTTDSAIMALRRMAARRGWPRVIYSDNGTNFRGADKELQVAYDAWLPELRKYGVTKGIEWHFIPPGAPHMGGAWERLVRSIKTALAATLTQREPREEVLHTLLTEAEYSVNARPLTHVSVDPNDPEALTPNHFLLGNSSKAAIIGPCVEASRTSWKTAQALADQFWRRWTKEYLPTLVRRGETDNGQTTLQKGDVVIIIDNTFPRNTWPRGIIERTFPGPDGRVRAVDVRTRGGVFRRPASKIAVLPTSG